MKIALVHDQLKEFGGAERVLVSLTRIFPRADVYTAFYSENTLEKYAPEYKNWSIKTSWFARMPGFLRNLYSPLRFLAPLIWESFDFSGYDLVISSSGWYMSKGIITKPGTTHICYLHHQPRYLYYYETSLEWQKYFLIRIYAHLVNHKLRIWDYISSQRPDYFIVNSQETKKRVNKFYRRDSTVIYPPVQMSKALNVKREALNNNYYLTVSRLVKTKTIELLIKVANEKKLQLKIVGGGRDEESLKSIAGDTIEFLGTVSDKQLTKLYANARAFLFAAVDEEFGISPVEAMGAGTPVIAYADGGLKETVQDGINGLLFHELSEKALSAAIQKFESLPGEKHLEMRKNARKIAENFSEEKFKEQVLNFIKEFAGKNG